MNSPNHNISSLLASSIITSHDSNPSISETNSLQILQKRTEEVLDSATQSFSTGNLFDELSYRTGAYFDDNDKNDDPTLKQRCRYCKKVFGSDSALQIHLRSHTGERPFKCKICSSCFTTKGNLKVHYQRHIELLSSTGEMIEQVSYNERMDPKSLLMGHIVLEPFLKTINKNDELNPNKVKTLFNNDNPENLSDSTYSKAESAHQFFNFDHEYSSPKKKAWEKHMEIMETPKASELQQNEAYRVNPNKCPICNRLLSCRSALRQHYRTHTGERPFRCRLCMRSFTTKGNLKTHIAVHKINPLLNAVHSCKICSKKYSTSYALQQHTNIHTGAPIEMTIDQIRAAEIHDFTYIESLADFYGSNSSLDDESSARGDSTGFDLQGNQSSFAIDLTDSNGSTSSAKRYQHSKCESNQMQRISTSGTTKNDAFPLDLVPMLNNTSIPFPSTSQISSKTFSPIGFQIGKQSAILCSSQY